MAALAVPDTTAAERRDHRRQSVKRMISSQRASEVLSKQGGTETGLGGWVEKDTERTLFPHHAVLWFPNLSDTESD